MASPKFFFGFVLSAVAISMVGAQLPPNMQVAQVDVIGRVVCALNGNAVPGANSPGIAGVNVHVQCNNGTVDLGTIVTNTTGFFDGVLRTVDGVLFNPSVCVATVQLPIADCTLLPPTGVLHSVLGVGGLVDTVLGSVQQIFLQAWAHVAAP